jgi:GAF domain-containing protein
VFVALTDTLVADFDVADLFHDLAGACVELLEVSAAGLMLVDLSGRLRVMSSSSERSRLLELMEIQNDEGPCLDCHREGVPVLVADLAAERARWPSFADEAIRVGFAAVYALPMRLRSDTIGALNLFHRDPDTITEATLRIGQALADVATIAILQQRAVQAREELSEQLQTALNSRVIIEQAKGVLAERQQIDMSAAFTVLRGYARGTQQRLSDVARAVVAGELSIDQLPTAAPGG